MNFDKAVRAISELSTAGVTSVGFVTPIVSACLAAARISLRLPPNSVQFTSDSLTYATNSSLTHHLGVSATAPRAGSAAGLSYCQVAHLRSHAEVNACNRQIGGFLNLQLGNCPNSKLVEDTRGVVGELHDNIACHANGAGFSAAQMYRGSKKVIQIGIADCGCGLLGSVHQAGMRMTAMEAIEWCLTRGNTTAKSPNPPTSDVFGPQRLPADSFHSPYPEGVSTVSSDSHHMGEGLFRLTELVASTGGSTWIWSGNAQIVCRNQTRTPIDSDVEWTGTAIEIELPVSAFESCQVANDSKEYEILARRLNL